MWVLESIVEGCDWAGVVWVEGDSLKYSSSCSGDDRKALEMSESQPCPVQLGEQVANVRTLLVLCEAVVEIN